MKKILLVGFSRFGDYTANSSAIIAKKLNGKNLNGYDIHSKTFPARIPRNDRGLEIFELARNIRASGIVCLGMSSSKKGFSVEKRATNCIEDSRYCPKELLDTCIEPRHMYGQRVEVDLRPWRIELFDMACRHANVCEIELSEEAGSFCSNHMMYQMYCAQTLSRSFAVIPWIFMHVPCCPEAITKIEDEFKKANKETMTVQSMILGVKLLIAGAKLEPS